jgi:hypothetical protein
MCGVRTGCVAVLQATRLLAARRSPTPQPSSRPPRSWPRAVLPRRMPLSHTAQPSCAPHNRLPCRTTGPRAAQPASMPHNRPTRRTTVRSGVRHAHRVCGCGDDGRGPTGGGRFECEPGSTMTGTGDFRTILDAREPRNTRANGPDELERMISRSPAAQPTSPPASFARARSRPPGSPAVRHLGEPLQQPRLRPLDATGPLLDHVRLGGQPDAGGDHRTRRTANDATPGAAPSRRRPEPRRPEPVPPRAGAAPSRAAPSRAAYDAAASPSDSEAGSRRRRR